MLHISASMLGDVHHRTYCACTWKTPPPPGINLQRKAALRCWLACCLAVRGCIYTVCFPSTTPHLSTASPTIITTIPAMVLVYMHYTSPDHSALVFSFRTDVFFNVLLPPIIFNAGFSVKKKLFFANFVTLTLFGVVGTFVSVVITSTGCHALLTRLSLVHGQHGWTDALALGTILSSTDSVATLQVLKPVWVCGGLICVGFDVCGVVGPPYSPQCVQLLKPPYHTHIPCTPTVHTHRYYYYHTHSPIIVIIIIPNPYRMHSQCSTPLSLERVWSMMQHPSSYYVLLMLQVYVPRGWTLHCCPPVLEYLC